MNIKRGDTVKILYGKDSGKTGKVLKLVANSTKVVVDGMNVFKKHIKGDGQKRTSEVVEIVKAMNIAKLMVVCPECGKTTRVAMKTVDGKKLRMCKKCGKTVEIKVSTEVKEGVTEKVKKVAKKSNVKKAE
jgi:large subunit ribosomal protein L24